MSLTRPAKSIVPALRSLSIRPRAYATCARPLYAAWATQHDLTSRARPLFTTSTAPPTWRTSIGSLQNQQARHASSKPTEELRKTPLYDLHVSHGAKMVPFGGFSMPVQYSDMGVVDSHNWTREKASLFDVSHMVQYHISGPGASSFLSRITPSAIETIQPHHSTLSCLLHPGTGGIVDDTIVTRLGPELFYIVTNAGCREKDAEYLNSQVRSWKEDTNNGDVKLEELSDNGLVALQGPLAASILESVVDNPADAKLNEVLFGQSKSIKLRLPSGESCGVLASRGGYTGEDGFEMSIPGRDLTVQVTELLLNNAGPEKLRLAGLGARDSLRLEAGMCLYGHDLDDTTTPVEAGLSWVIAKERRATGGFHGAETILAQLKPKKDGGTGVTRRRVGLVVEGAPAREGAEIVDSEGNAVGKVTSGCPSPTLKKNIAMGYVKNGMHKAGTELAAVVRGKRRKAVVTKMPFVPSKYWKGGASPA